MTKLSKHKKMTPIRNFAAQEFIAFIVFGGKRPTPETIISFLDSEVKKYSHADKTGQRRVEVEYLIEYYEGANRALLDKDYGAAMWYCCLAGYALQRLQLPPEKFIIANRKRIDDTFGEKAMVAGFLKQHAQNIALDLWAEDSDQKIRLTDMCSKTFPLIKKFRDEKVQQYSKGKTSAFIKYFEQGLPGDPEGLRAWLRPIAPAYAKKGGRSKKK